MPTKTLKFFPLLAWLMLLSLPAFGQAGTSAAGPAVGAFKNPEGMAPVHAPFVCAEYSADLTAERKLTGSTGVVVTDNGANGTIVLTLNNALAAGLTGGTSQQTAVDSILNYAGKAAGDMLYYDGANWSRLAVGTAGQWLGVVGTTPTWTNLVSPGADPTCAFVTVGATGLLANERAITAGTGITGTDSGAGGAYTLAIDTAVVLADTNTITATNKTFTSPKLTYSATLGLRLANAANTQYGNITWADWSASRLLTIPDPGTDASFVMTEAAATINGTKTFSDLKLSGTTFKTAANTITVPAATDTLVNLNSSQVLTNKELTAPVMTSGSNIVLAQTGGNYTITWNNPLAGRAYTIRDVNGAAHFAMTGTATTYTAGGVGYGDGYKFGVTAAGTAGQCLISNGASAPAFGVLGGDAGGTGQTTWTAGDLLTVNDANAPVKLAGGSDGQVLTYDSTGNPNVKWSSAGTGSVTSVAATVPAEFSISGSPVTTSGTLAITKTTQTANYFWAGPTSGAAAAPSFRAIGAADIAAGRFKSTPQTLYNTAHLTTVAHSLGYTPEIIHWAFECTDPGGDQGWADGDVVTMGNGDAAYAYQMFVCYADGTNVYIRYAQTGSPYFIPNKSTGTLSALDMTKWGLVLYAR